MTLNKLWIFLGFLLLNLSSLCISEAITAEIDCSTGDALSLTATDLVLVGTDVVNVKDFKQNHEQLSKRYSTEIGGATLVLSLDFAPDYQTIIRTFKVPGQPDNAKTYNLCASEEDFSSDKLRLKVVKDGVLLLEADPGIEGIPNDLWILYSREN